jgi:hypothetical protein
MERKEDAERRIEERRRIESKFGPQERTIVT